MKTYARVKPAEKRIIDYVVAEDDEVVLPFEATMDEIKQGESLVLAAAQIRVFDDRVVEHRSAVRALKGLVAVLDADGAIVKTKDLGPDRIPVADNVFPFEEVLPKYDDATQTADGPTIERGEGPDGVVRRIWTVRDRTSEELAAEAALHDKEDLESAFGTVGIDLLLDYANRVTKLAGEPEITRKDFERRALENIRAKR